MAGTELRALVEQWRKRRNAYMQDAGGKMDLGARIYDEVSLELSALLAQAGAPEDEPEIIFKSKKDAAREVRRLEAICKKWYDRAEAAEAEVKRLRGEAGAPQPDIPWRELDNHHNALACPYCNPKRLKFAEEVAQAGAVVMAQGVTGDRPATESGVGRDSDSCPSHDAGARPAPDSRMAQAHATDCHIHHAWVGQNRPPSCSCGLAQAGAPRCQNCDHVEPHTGPAGDVADACTHPMCNCGFDSRPTVQAGAPEQAEIENRKF